MALIENMLQLLVTVVAALLSGITKRQSRRPADSSLLFF